MLFVLILNRANAENISSKFIVICSNERIFAIVNLKRGLQKA